MPERTPDRPIRVVIADDHHIWRSGLRVDLGDGFEVVGESEDAGTAIEVIDRTRPDLALVDLHMPGGGGLAVVRACATETPIVIITVSEAERDLLDAIATGAVGYLVGEENTGLKKMFTMMNEARLGVGLVRWAVDRGIT